jgi:transcription elongation factor GreA
MIATSPTQRVTKELGNEIRMTREVRTRLEAERDQLATQLAVPPTISPQERMSEDEVVEPPSALWDRQQLARRLETLQDVLRRAQVVVPDGSAVVGSQVVMRDDDGLLDTFTLVVPGEANSRTGQVSIDSPLGQALLGRRAGDRTEVDAPGGVWPVTVVQVA